MKMHHVFFGLALICAVGGYSAAQAAVINFGPAGTMGEFIDSNSIDLSLGNLVYAANASSAGDDQVVNVGATPVLFEAVATSLNVDQNSGFTHNGAIGSLYGTATDQASLDEVLNSHGFDDNAPVTLTLNNLVVGQQYRVQVIGPADSRGCCNGRKHTVASSVGGVANGGTAGDISRFVDPSGDGTKHVLTAIGDFTADATTQELLLAGANNGGWSGLILTSRAIPEPTSLGLMGIAGLFAVRAARRRLVK